VALGNTVIVTFAMDPATGTVSCADTKGNTYTKDADVQNGTSGSGTGVRTVVFSAPITTALVSGNTITVTFPSVTAKAVSANEFSGLVSAALDKTATATGATTSMSSGNSASTAQANELLIGAFGVEDKAAIFTAGSSFTALSAGTSNGSGGAATNIQLFPEYRVVSASAVYAATGTLGTGMNWAAALATYKDKCGNGSVDAGEQCDGGACCNTNCTFASASTQCRAAAGECDLAETCTGSSATCPADAVKANGTSCTADTNPCTLDQCDGTNATCQHPAGNAGAVCRSSAPCAWTC
jgi:hypothetical protein